MKTKKLLKSQEGFTLVEIIAVLVIMGILASVAMTSYSNLLREVEKQAIKAAVSELNRKETLRWCQLKMGPTSFGTDAVLNNEIVTGTTGGGWDTDCGADYVWNAGDPAATGGDLSFRLGAMVTLSRTPATLVSPATWRRKY